MFFLNIKTWIRQQEIGVEKPHELMGQNSYFSSIKRLLLLLLLLLLLSLPRDSHNTWKKLKKDTCHEKLFSHVGQQGCAMCDHQNFKRLYLLSQCVYSLKFRWFLALTRRALP
jgi:hypothetical protein